MKELEVKKIKRITTFNNDNYFHGRDLPIRKIGAHKIIKDALKLGAKLTQWESGIYVLKHNDNHWLEVEVDDGN